MGKLNELDKSDDSGIASPESTGLDSPTQTSSSPIDMNTLLSAGVIKPEAGDLKRVPRVYSGLDMLGTFAAPVESRVKPSARSPEAIAAEKYQAYLDSQPKIDGVPHQVIMRRASF